MLVPTIESIKADFLKKYPDDKGSLTAKIVHGWFGEDSFRALILRKFKDQERDAKWVSG